MSDKKVITVFGATGNQGGSVIDIVLARTELSSKYALRGVTCDPSSSKSKALADKGVEMVKADLDDVEAMKQAIKGSYGVFGATDFWAIMDKQREIQQGKNIFEAAKSQGVKHYVFSSLPHVEKLTNGELKHVEHFDGKAEVAEYIEENKGDMLASYFMPAIGSSLSSSNKSATSMAHQPLLFPSHPKTLPGPSSTYAAIAAHTS